MAISYLPEFIMSTGRLLAAIQALRKSSSANETSEFWTQVLDIFFPETEGFEISTIYKTSDHAILVLRRIKDADGDVIIDDCDMKNILVIDCQPPPISTTATVESEVSVNLKGTPDNQGAKVEGEATHEERLPSDFGVTAIGTQAIFVRDAELLAISAAHSHTSQDEIHLHGSKIGSANLAKASGRDQVEKWLHVQMSKRGFCFRKRIELLSTAQRYTTNLLAAHTETKHLHAQGMVHARSGARSKENAF
ncbi:hypothetical protein BGW36DRAFT_456513 [Talaromyces proteolyticus]|uniref:Uncharacterized protein n=1 Tax=Talaromyces proteolyticus TaxID=1131652 RepID=A0AAD4L6Q4_9EURO|nr:uncharacterized protein BGW36DRAFT_456513 [Talaromyces proteolyticus]KAH8704959.1 hypothetical protein BGW36DRAFT_456513 [Talaromyces proteolyticus]